MCNKSPQLPRTLNTAHRTECFNIELNIDKLSSRNLAYIFIYLGKILVFRVGGCLHFPRFAELNKKELISYMDTLYRTHSQVLMCVYISAKYHAIYGEG